MHCTRAIERPALVVRGLTDHGQRAGRVGWRQSKCDVLRSPTDLMGLVLPRHALVVGQRAEDNTPAKQPDSDNSEHGESAAQIGPATYRRAHDLPGGYVGGVLHVRSDEIDGLFF